MGDRALVIFTDGKEVSPTAYLHWNGSEVPAWLVKHKEIMASRGADLQYAVARFIGYAHTQIDGNLSLGCWNTSPQIQEATRKLDAEVLGKHSHGDGGVVIVNVNDYTWQAFGGYLTPEKEAA